MPVKVKVICTDGEEKVYDATSWKVHPKSGSLNVLKDDEAIAGFAQGTWKAVHFTEV